LHIFLPSIPYSVTLAKGFFREFSKDPTHSVFLEPYTRNQRQSIENSLRDALILGPDLIYFAGYSNDFDLLLTEVNSQWFINPLLRLHLVIIGGDAAYDLAGYTKSNAVANFRDIFFTAFAYPDEWGTEKACAPVTQKPRYFCEYGDDFDPSGQHPGI
jgi:hypothetical protein